MKIDINPQECSDPYVLRTMIEVLQAKLRAAYMNLDPKANHDKNEIKWWLEDNKEFEPKW